MRSHYLNKKQSTIITVQISHRWKKTRFFVLQGTILGSILLDILHSNLYLGVDNTDFASYADDNNIYDTGDCMSYFFCGTNIQNVFLVLSW